MPVDTKSDLPKGVKDNLPSHAQEIWKEAYNSSLETYDDPDKRRDESEDKETVAAKVAWNAVKSEYEKDDSGKWKRKD